MTGALKTYLEKIKTHFPEVSLENAKLLTKGWDHDVVILGDKLVFRFPKRDEYNDRFKAEIKLLRYLAPKMPVPTPDYRYIPDDLSFGGYKMVPGVEMTSEIFNKFSDTHKEAIAEQLGKFLSVMHATPIETAKGFGFEEDESGYFWSKNYTERTLKDAREKVFPKLNQEEIQWIEHQFARYLSLLFDFDTALIHSDFTDDHIFVNASQGVVTGVIDFADTEFSDPALDFAGTWYYGNSFPQQVLNYYAHKTDIDFLKRSKFPVLVNMVHHMLEFENGKTDRPYTFDSERIKLNERMASGLSL